MTVAISQVSLSITTLQKQSENLEIRFGRKKKAIIIIIINLMKQSQMVPRRVHPPDELGILIIVHLGKRTTHHHLAISSWETGRGLLKQKQSAPLLLWRRKRKK